MVTDVSGMKTVTNGLGNLFLRDAGIISDDPNNSFLDRLRRCTELAGKNGLNIQITLNHDYFSLNFTLNFNLLLQLLLNTAHYLIKQIFITLDKLNLT